jgi:hypothetical protein
METCEGLQAIANAIYALAGCITGLGVYFALRKR